MKFNEELKTKSVLTVDLGFILAISAVIFVFLLDLFTLKQGFLSGDHLAQHYPWASFLAEQIHRFRLPWWCPFNQCGFPLLAEGQVGAFYPPNLIFLGLLPLDIAYNYEALFHYFVAGIGFYFYVRRLGLGGTASFLGTVLFLFGSAQGGFSYNITSQRVLAWFPISLLLIDCLLKNPRFLFAGLLALVFAFQAVAGYQQFSIYFYGFAVLYFVFLWITGKSTVRSKSLGLFVLAVVLSFGLSLPQWIPFLELSQFSARANAIEELAYVGSMNPFGFATLFFPSWHGFLGTDFYVSVLGIFFAFVGLVGKKTRHAWAIIFLLVVSLLYALGKFDPLYVAFVKLTHFYVFRVPAKVLFFASFALAVLAAMGFQKILEGAEDIAVRRAFKIFFWTSVLALIGFAAVSVLLRAGREVLYPIAENYVKTHFAGGSAIHPHSQEIYIAKLKSIYDVLLLQTNILNPRVVASIVFTLISVLAAFWAKKFSPWILVLIVSVNLFLFSLISVKGNYESFERTRPRTRILDILRQDKSNFRTYCFISEPESKMGDQYPSFSNFNVYHRIEDIGIYSPFAMKAYKQFLGNLGSVNDSLFLVKATMDALREKRDVLNFLDVKYILSDKPLEGFSPVAEENGIYLYENKERRGRYSGMDEVRELKRDNDQIVIQGNAKADSELIASEINYPGWKAFVDGKEVPIKSYQGLFRSLDVTKGEHKIEFRYSVSRFSWIFIAAILSLGVCLICILLF